MSQRKLQSSGRIVPLTTALSVLAAVVCVSSLGAANRITDAVDPARTIVLKGRAHPLARPEFDHGPVAGTKAIQYASIYFKPVEGLETFLEEQRNPSSPNYQRWLTPEQFGDRFGLTTDDAAKVAAWLRSRGLQVHDVARGRQWISFSGSAAQVAAAFQTELRQFEVGGETHFAMAKDPAVPAALAHLVSNLGGLDDFGPKPMYKLAPESGTGSGQFQPRETTGANHYLAPDDLSTIYNVTPLYQAGIDGTGQKIAVIGQTDVNISDMRAYRTRFSLPPNDPQVVLFGPDPGVSSGDQHESNLDLQVAGAIARNATIIFATSTSIRTSAQYAVDQNLAPIMTLSYGYCANATRDTYRAIAQQANAQGITWMTSAGDFGAATCDDGNPTPQATHGPGASYPADVPEITAVGGTQFDDTNGNWWAVANSATRASALGYIPEKAWNEFSKYAVEAGGGPSLLYPKPLWQTGPGVPNDPARDTPDISFTASVYDGYECIYNGGVVHFGGTSASSPLFASMIALLNHAQAIKDPKAPVGLGNINPTLYRMAQTTTGVFHDIVNGDNKLPCAQGSPSCVDGLLGDAAGPGYDLATGLGSMDIAQFVGQWASVVNSTTTLSASPATYAIDGTVQLTATVTGSGPVPTGSVTFIGNDVTLGTVTLVPGDKASTASLTVAGGLLAPGNGAISATYVGDGNYSASSGTTSVKLQIPATGSMMVISVTPNPVRQVGTTWPYSVLFTEKAGVPTTLTAYTINGVDNFSGIRTSAKIAANGSTGGASSGSGITPPLNRTFHLEGLDADGTTWKRDLVVPFLAGVAGNLVPSMNLNAAPATVQRNPQADPSCQWQQRLTLRETSGGYMYLSSLNVAGTSLTSQIPTLFGTTRLAPWGMLTATVCFATAPSGTTGTATVSAVSEDFGTTVTASAPAAFVAAPASASAFSVSVPSIAMVASGSGTASVDLQFAGGTPSWKATVLAPGTQNWLTQGSSSGTGPSTLQLQANAAGLSKGAYNALVSVEATNSVPQVIQIPVAFVVGDSPDITISGIGNAASGAQVFSPGQLAAVYGTGLASALQIAAVQPLPFTFSGTSATVNGVSAPLWFVSPTQINLQIPFEASAGTATLAINNGGKVAAYNIQIGPAAPGIFTDLSKNMVPIASGTPGQTIFGFITGDGDLTPTIATGATNPSSKTFPKSRQTVTMTIGGENAPVVFNGLVNGLIGVTQVNFTIPADAKVGPQPVVVTVGGVSSVPATITVTAPK